MHVQAWFDGMQYRIQRLAVTQGINAWLRQYPLNVQGCEGVQAVLLHEYGQQFQVSVILL
ncbi:hypothetical protein D3C81_2270310 [compost metagenome]